VSHAPVAGLFDDLGKIVEYNTKFIGTAIAGLTDSRTARASHILFGFNKYQDGEAQAAELKERISSGEITFADAAAKYSTCPSSARGGDLGQFKRGAMVPEFDEVCFSDDVPLGGLEGPVKTQFGHHLIQVVERSEKQ
jgi:peptidyl-prolyl cis-trans isomerase C